MLVRRAVPVRADPHILHTLTFKTSLIIIYDLYTYKGGVIVIFGTRAAKTLKLGADLALVDELGGSVVTTTTPT